MNEMVLQDRNTLKSKQAPQRALQKAFYQLRVFSDQVAQLLTCPHEQITMPGGSEPAGQKREGNGRDRDRAAAPAAQAMSCSHWAQGHKTRNIQLSPWPRLIKTSWAKASPNWRDDVAGIRLKGKKEEKTRIEIKMLKITRLSCVLINYR